MPPSTRSNLILHEAQCWIWYFHPTLEWWNDVNTENWWWNLLFPLNWNMSIRFWWVTVMGKNRPNISHGEYRSYIKTNNDIYKTVTKKTPQDSFKLNTKFETFLTLITELWDLFPSILNDNINFLTIQLPIKYYFLWL